MMDKHDHMTNKYDHMTDKHDHMTDKHDHMTHKQDSRVRTTLPYAWVEPNGLITRGMSRNVSSRALTVPH